MSTAPGLATIAVILLGSGMTINILGNRGWIQGDNLYLWMLRCFGWGLLFLIFAFFAFIFGGTGG